MSFLEAREIAIKALALAIEKDGSSGGNLRIVNVKNSGESSEELLFNNEVKRIINS